LPSTDRPAVQVAGLTGFPLRRFADFSYVRHLFSPDNFQSCGYRDFPWQPPWESTLKRMAAEREYSGGIHAMPLLPSKDRRMSKTRLYPDDIREAVLADIRAFDACRNVRNIAIVPVNAPEAETNWAIDFIADGAARISHDCKIQIIALQNRMQREYEAIWPDD
jgi:hypothetical protein